MVGDNQTNKQTESENRASQLINTGLLTFAILTRNKIIKDCFINFFPTSPCQSAPKQISPSLDEHQSDSSRGC